MTFTTSNDNHCEVKLKHGFQIPRSGVLLRDSLAKRIAINPCIIIDDLDRDDMTTKTDRLPGQARLRD